MIISVLATRLTQGTDLKIAVQELVNKHRVSAGSLVSCVGCLSKINLRLAGAETTLVTEGSFEIVSIMGTLTPSHQHIHIAVADRKGHVMGGHLLEGNIVDSTAEVIIHSYPQLNFSRTFDSSTGYTEMVIDKC
ncbi:PPC domain-containing DNA-binding protein [Endozoicomonas atrinae]|uniref:PPC domain-containing DNA-binding protein n=1 Tax=Endozoicomonas atrinae TaxID=1333660 RepID=UPI000A41A39F|nr:DUF296 domain-containing protein [Endozoicomonas atrinae]